MEIALFILFIAVIGLWLYYKSVPRRSKQELEQEWEQIRKEQREQKQREQQLKNEIIEEILSLIQQCYLVQPCSKCHEFKMRLIDFSTNARSIHYQCMNCGKKMRAAAVKPEVFSQVTNIKKRLFNLANQHPTLIQEDLNALSLEFETTPAPLPYEQTSRIPIPEAIRAEVWRRDQGMCVNCGSKENLQFDHIIPVSRGGATSVQNLQILCMSCNLSKGKKI